MLRQVQQRRSPWQGPALAVLAAMLVGVSCQPAPGDLTVGTPECKSKPGSVVVLWKAPAGAASYRVLRGPADGSAPPAPLAEAVIHGPKPAYVDESAPVGVEQAYGVVALGADGSAGAPSPYCVAAAKDPEEALRPYFVTEPVLTALVGQAYRYDADAEHPDPAARLTYSLFISPEDMVIDPETGVVAWTPGPEDVGAHPVKILVEDEAGRSAKQFYTLVVSDGGPPTNLPPEIVSDPVGSAVAGEAYVYLVDAEDPDGDVLAFSLEVAPVGMTVDPVSGRIDWTPTDAQVGTASVRVRATDPGGLFDAQDFGIMVASPPNRAPVVQALLSDAARPAQRFQTFFGEDVNRTEDPATPTVDDPVRPAALPASQAARDRFLRELATGVAVGTFEDLSPGPTPNLLEIGEESVALLGPSALIVDRPTGTKAGRYPISGRRFLEGETRGFEFTVRFEAPVGAFGFFATDVADEASISGQLVLDLLDADGGVRSVEVPHAPPPEIGSNSGSALFFGVISTDRPITEITFRNSEDVVDAIGFDDLVIARPDQVISGLLEGESVALAPATFTDAEPEQTHVANVSWGGVPDPGAVLIESAGAGTVASRRSFPDDADTSVEVCVTDSEGATGCDSAPVEVQNLPPRIECSLEGFRLLGILGDGTLVENDPLTGEQTVLAETGLPSWGGLDWHPQRGVLYGIPEQSTNPQLARLDPLTGEAEIIGPITLDGVQVGLAEGIAFDPHSGGLLAAVGIDLPPRDFTSELLVSLDPDTGEATLVAPFGETSVLTSSQRPPGEGDADDIEFIGAQLMLADVSGQPPLVAGLVRADHRTGETEIVFEGEPNIATLAYSETTQQLFAAQALPEPALYRIDPASGAATLIQAGTVPGVLAVVPPRSVPVTIDFDSLPGMFNSPGDLVPEPSRLGDAFLSTLGVSFRSDADYVAVSEHAPFPTVSPPNVIGGVTASGELSYGTPIEISFFDPANPTIQRVTDFVTIRGEQAPIVGSTATMEAFDVFGASLGSVTAADSVDGLTLHLNVPGIHSVRLTQDSPGFGFDGTIGFDDLSFTIDPGCSTGGLYAIVGPPQPSLEEPAEGPRRLVQIDLDSGRAREIGDLTGDESMGPDSLTYDAVRGALFASFRDPAALVRIDPITGTSLEVGSFPVSTGESATAVCGLDVNPRDGRLYAIFSAEPSQNPCDRIGTVDPETSEITPLATLFQDDPVGDHDERVDADAIEWVDGVLYAVDAHADGDNATGRTLAYRIDPETGFSELIGEFGEAGDFLFLFGLAYAEPLGTLFGASSVDERIVSLDLEGFQFEERFRPRERTFDIAFAVPPPFRGSTSVVEGEAASLTLRFSDPGVLDTHEGVIDWGDGSVDSPRAISDDGTGFVGGSHVYVQDGTYDVEVCVRDDDGGEGCTTVSVQVFNASPEIAPIPDAALDEGGLLEIEADFTDPGREDVHVARIDWGDGSPEDAFLVTQGVEGGIVSASHVYVERGEYDARLCIDDGSDLGCRSFVVSVNGAPAIVSSPPVSTVPGAPYAYAVAAEDDPSDVLAFALDEAPAGMTIDPVTGLVLWTPVVSQLGDHDVSVRATDSRGLSDVQSYTVAVAPDVTPPGVTVILDTPRIDPGGEAVLTVTAEDDGAPPDVSVTVNGVPIPLDDDGRATIPGTESGPIVIIVVVTDGAGNETTETTVLAVTDPDDDTPPVAQIDAPADLAEVTFIEDLIGTATDENLFRYQVGLARGTDAPFELLEEGFAPVVSDVLATLDATLLENGLYRVRLVAEDVNGATAVAERAVRIAGDAKVGRYRLTFLDLHVPVSGVPVRIERAYDSRDGKRGDFGLGWRLELRRGSFDHNRLPGRGWDIRAGGGFLGLPCQVVVEDQSHLTEVRLSDSEFYAFRPVLSEPFSIAGGCVAEASYEFVDGSTRGAALEILDGATVFQASGSADVTRFDDPTGETYEPRRVRLRTRDGRVVDLDADAGGVTRIVDPNGNTLTIEPDGLLHSTGLEILFVRDAEGRIARIEDPEGQSLLYSYDADGNLDAAVDRSGNETRFTYEAPGRLSEILDPLGRPYVRSEYDADGRLVATVDGNGNRTEFQHDLADRREVQIDRLGNVTVQEYDLRGNVVTSTDPLGQVTTTTYDADDNRTSRTDPEGRVSLWSYDAAGDVVSWTDFDGNTTLSTYDSAGRLLAQVDPEGETTQYVYDASGNLTEILDPDGGVARFAYDDAGNPESETDPLGNVRTYTYDERGNRMTETDPLGNVRSFTWDATGNMLSESAIRTQGDGSVETETVRFAYDADGRIVRRTDASGAVSTREYDGLGRVVRTEDANGNVVRFSYDGIGNLAEVSYPDGSTALRDHDAEGRLVRSVDRDGRETRFEYDALGRQTETLHPDGTRTTRAYDGADRLAARTDERGNVTTFAYGQNQVSRTDPLGHVWIEDRDSAGRLERQVDPLGRETRFEHDGRGNLVRTVFADGTERRSVHDAAGRVIEEIDEAGLVTRFAYDGRGQLAAVTDALGNVTRYGYDERGNQVSRTDALGRVTRMEYDAEGRLVRRTLPLGESELLTYDLVGNRTSQTDFRGETTTFEYDADRREVARRFTDGSSIESSWSPAGLRLTAGGDAYLYDARSRLTSEIKADGSVLAYGYDAAGNRTEVSIGAETTTYLYDAANRLASVTDSELGTTSYVRDAVGNRVAVVYPNGTMATFSHDARDRVEQVRHEGPTSLLQSFVYDIGPTGRRLGVTEAPSGRRVDYVYDDLHRLVEERIDEGGGVRTLAYAYDAVGNRVSRVDSLEGATAYVYDANDRLLEEQGPLGTIFHAYDANGSLVSVDDGLGLDEYGYDAEGRLVAASLDDGSDLVAVAFAYDADGLRTSATVDGVETRYLVDKNRAYGQVISEVTDGGTRRYVYGEARLAMDSDEGERFFHHDAQRSTRLLTDGTGAASDTYDYDAFGVALSESGNSANPYRYAGEPLDAATGLYYLRARYYQPGVGRFTARDPWRGDVFQPLTLHPYVYVQNDPMNRLDPSGAIGILSTIGNALNSAFVRSIGFLSAAGTLLTRGLDRSRSLRFNTSINLPKIFNAVQNRGAAAGYRRATQLLNEAIKPSFRRAQCFALRNALAVDLAARVLNVEESGTLFVPDPRDLRILRVNVLEPLRDTLCQGIE